MGSISIALGLDSSALAVNWFTWWLGDVSGLVLLTPLIVYLVRQPYRKPSLGRLTEGVVLVLATAGIAQIALTGFVDISRVWALPGQFLIIVLVIWTAFSLGPRVSMLSVNVVAAVAVIAAVNRQGPFIGSSLNATLLSLQAAMCGLGIAALILATLVEQRRVALLAVEASRDELEQKVRERTAQLEELATHDSLTGLLNRRAFASALARAVEEARRGHSSALFYGDLDGFKEFNDTRGHADGDAALLYGASIPSAIAVSERMCARVSGLGDAAGAAMVMSAGLVAVDGALGEDDVLAAADRAMYVAKARHDGSKVAVAETVVPDV